MSNECASNGEIIRTYLIDDYSTVSGCTIVVDEINSCSPSGITINSDVFVNGSLYSLIFSGGTFYGDGSQLSGISTDNFYVTGGTFDDNTKTLTLFRNDGNSVLITGFTDYYVTGGTYSNGTLTLDRQNGFISISGFLTGTTNTYVTGFTYSNNNLIISQNEGQPDLVVNIDVMSGLTINGSLSATTYYGDGSNLTGVSFTGNTSGDCITDLYVQNLNSCSPLHIQNISSGDILIGENGGVNVGIGTGIVSGDSKVIIESDTNIPLVVKNVGSSNTLELRDINDTPRIFVDFTNQLGFTVDQYGPFYFGAFSNPSGNRVGWSIPGKVLMGISANNERVGVGGYGSYFASQDPNALFEVRGKNDEIQQIIQGNNTQSTYISSWRDYTETDKIVIDKDFNFGIGTNSPTEKLHVSGNAKITGTLNIGTIGSGSPLINLGLDSSGNVVTGTTGGGTFTGNTSASCITDLYVQNLNSCSPLHIQPTNTGDVYIGENGGVNVGIGTSSTTAQLTVKGSGTTITTKTASFKDGNGVEFFKLTDDRTFDYNGIAKGEGSTNSFTSIIPLSSPATWYSGVYVNTTNLEPSAYFKGFWSNITGSNGIAGTFTNNSAGISTHLSNWSGWGVETTGGIFVNGDKLYLKGDGTGATSNTEIVNSSSNPLLYVLNNGNVGIGTSSPTEKLEVNGKTKTTTLQVTSGSTAGYVLTALDSNGNTYWAPSFSGTTDTDNFVTGGTFSNNVLTLNRQNGSVTVTGFTDYYVTGFTYNNQNKLTLSQNNGQSDLNLYINQFSGLSINGLSQPNGYALSVTGDTNFVGDVYVNGDLTYKGNLLVTGGTIIQNGLTANTIYTNYIDFNTTATTTTQFGRVNWDNDTGTLNIGIGDSTTGLIDFQVGQEEVVRVYNKEATTLLRGEIVYVYSSQGNRPSVKRALATGDGYSVTTLGMVASDITSLGQGYVTTFGIVSNLNTLGLTGGTAIWLSPTIPGGFTEVKPQAPNHTVLIGYVVRVSATVGSIFVNISNGWELDEIHDVRISGATTGDLLMRSSYSGSPVWINTKNLVGDYTISGNTNNIGSFSSTTFYGSGNGLYNIPISGVTNLQNSLDLKTDLTLFDSHTANTANPHQTSFYQLISTAHTHTISDITNLQSTLNSKFDVSGGTINGSLSASTYLGLPIDPDNYVTGGTYSDGTLTLNRQNGSVTISGILPSLEFTINGNSAVIQTSITGTKVMSGGRTFTKWAIRGWANNDGTGSGSIVLTLTKNGTSMIGAGNAPTLTSSQSNSATISGWTSTSVIEGDTLVLGVSSVTSLIGSTVILY